MDAKLADHCPARELQIAVNPKRAAKMLDVSRTTIYRWMESGKIQSFKIGSARRILVAELEALVERAMEQAP